MGVTTAKYPECKRGVATNLAATLARHNAVSGRVCVVDADPLALDVTTRLGAGGPVVEDFCRPGPPTAGALRRVDSPSMAVLPCGGGPLARIHLAAEPAFGVLSEAFDVVVCDVPGGPSGPGQALGTRLDLLDWLVLAVTPEPRRSLRRAISWSSSRPRGTEVTSAVSSWRWCAPATRALPR